MVSRRLLAAITLSIAFFPSVLPADSWDEFCEWRRRVGLPQLKEDPEMTKFALMKARYRAERGLTDGHQGPKAKFKFSYSEGTGEATPMWGWLTCCMEDSATHGGAGMCVDRSGKRYMVLVVRGGTGKPLISPHFVQIHKTAYLTPKPPRVK